MAGETLSASLSLIVDDMTQKSVKKSLKSGVMKNLVTVYPGTGHKGIDLPIWDKSTGGHAITKTEATNYTEFAAYTNSTWSITPTKKVFGTKLTDEDNWFANESVRAEHADKHAYEQALALEKGLVAIFASFTPALAATSTSGLTVARLMDAVTLLEGSAYDMERPYSTVLNSYAYNHLAKDMAQQGVASNYGPVGKLADDVLAKYFVNNVMGIVNVFQTPTTAIAASSTAICGLFGKQAIGLRVPLYYEFETERDASAGTTELISRAVWGARVRFADFGVKLTVTANSPS